MHAASVIRGDLKGEKNVSLNDSEITEDKAVELIPHSLFLFLKWIFEDSTEETSRITLDKNLSDSKRTNKDNIKCTGFDFCSFKWATTSTKTHWTCGSY